MAFDYEYWVDQFMRYPRNDAEDKGVGLSRHQMQWLESLVYML